jgi:hypothetical protein
MESSIVANLDLRIGQFSAYLGDRLDGMGELLDSGVDVLTGDYLAELTMLVLRKNQLRGGPGYATVFVEQLEKYLPRIAAGGVKVVTNAGGLEPDACADAVRAACARAGVNLIVASISGDDLREDLGSIVGSAGRIRNVDTGEELDLHDREILTANAYLGAWPIVAALRAGADIVICPRTTDASLIVGPAAWKYNWNSDDWDRLAGAVVAGHLIECGGQVTGGNFALFDEYPSLGLPGLPIAEIMPDGSCVITKALGTGGVVDTNTVTAQLLYEVGGPEYLNPDVTVQLTSVQVESVGENRVRLSGAQGRAPNEHTKLSLTFEGGYRNSVTVGLTGLHLEAKLGWLREAVQNAVGTPESFDGFRWTLVGPAREVDGDQAQATAWVVITARDADRSKVDRKNFADKIVQLGTSNIPGFYLTGPPQRERLFGIQWPCLVEKKYVQTRVALGSVDTFEVPWEDWESTDSGVRAPAPAGKIEALRHGPTLHVPLGSIIGTRSGDKGGVANVGVWARSAEGYAWLHEALTVERIAELLPEAIGLRIVRHEFPNLLAVNFLLYGYLEYGVSSCTRVDSQAKGLGEYLASQLVDIPVGLLPATEASPVTQGQ